MGTDIRMRPLGLRRRLDTVTDPVQPGGDRGGADQVGVEGATRHPVLDVKPLTREPLDADRDSAVLKAPAPVDWREAPQLKRLPQLTVGAKKAVRAGRWASWPPIHQRPTSESLPGVVSSTAQALRPVPTQAGSRGGGSRRRVWPMNPGIARRRRSRGRGMFRGRAGSGHLLVSRWPPRWLSVSAWKVAGPSLWRL